MLFSPFPCHLIPLTIKQQNIYFKICSLCTVAPCSAGNIQEIHFSSSGLHCLEADRPDKTKHYPGAVPSHWPKTNRRELHTIKQIAYYVTNTTTVHVHWYLIMATCFGLSLVHLQHYVHMYTVESVRTVLRGIRYCLQGVRESN